jgi:hypothetical protein
MQFFALGLIAASAVVYAETKAEQQHGRSNSRSWIRDFDNLVAFGDR